MYVRRNYKKFLSLWTLLNKKTVLKNDPRPPGTSGGLGCYIILYCKNQEGTHSIEHRSPNNKDR